MNLKWKKLLVNLSVWLVAEIILTVLGLDNLADYSEFVFQSQTLASVQESIAMVSVLT